MTTTTTEREASLVRLRELLHPGDTMFTVLRHVSRSGMRRSISPVITRDGDIFDISGDVARVLGCRFDVNNGGVILDGAGMDMGYHLVYELAYRLFPDLERGDYALQHRWL